MKTSPHKLSDKTINEILELKTEWEPGEVAVTDLSRFPGCVPDTEEGLLAKEASDEYHATSEDNRRDSYVLPVTSPGNAMKTMSFLKTWKVRQDGLLEGKKAASECSNFSYDAIAECLLNNEIRNNYDILQAGSMYIDQGLGKKTYAHNIAILVPKGEGASYKGGNVPLPEGSLIVDPWARAMGQSAESSLFCSTDNFCFSGTLYPLQVNYNSARLASPMAFFGGSKKTVDDEVQEFKGNYKVSGLLEKVSEIVATDAHGAGQTKDISEELSKDIKKAFNLSDDAKINNIEFCQEAGTVKVEYELSGTTYEANEENIMSGKHNVIGQSATLDFKSQLKSMIKEHEEQKEQENEYEDTYERANSLGMS